MYRYLLGWRDVKYIQIIWPQNFISWIIIIYIRYAIFPHTIFQFVPLTIHIPSNGWDALNSWMYSRFQYIRMYHMSTVYIYIILVFMIFLSLFFLILNYSCLHIWPGCLVYLFKQNGVVCSIKPQQVTYIVPGIFDFDHTLIADFNLKAQQLFVSVLLSKFILVFYLCFHLYLRLYRTLIFSSVHGKKFWTVRRQLPLQI